MINNPFTIDELIEALTNKKMDLFERNCILGYYGFTIQEILIVRQQLETNENKVEEIKENIVSILKNEVLERKELKDV